MATYIVKKLLIELDEGDYYTAFISEKNVCFVSCNENGHYDLNSQESQCVFIPKNEWKDVVRFVNSQLKRND